MMNIVMPMAGLGTRMNSQVPKHLITIQGVPLFLKALNTFWPTIWQHAVNIIFVVQEQHLAASQQHIQDQNVQWVTVNGVTSGPAATVMAARHLIDNKHPLFTLNCDQVFHWDAPRRLHQMTQHAAGVFVFPSQDAKCSYVRMEGDCAVEFAEKQVISPWALTGVHYWREGRWFVKSCEQMMQQDVRVRGEHYISMTYNHLVQDVCVGVVHVDEQETQLVGTEQELLQYASKKIT